MNNHLSIRRRLLGMLLSAVLLVWLVVLLLVYRSAEHEVEEVFDADLARSARILQSLLLHEVEEEREINHRVHEAMAELGPQGLSTYPKLAAALRDYRAEAVAEEANERLELVSIAQQAGHKYGAGLIFVARFANGGLMMRDSAAPEIPAAADGYADMVLNDETWRIYSLTEPRTGFMVQVGEKRAFRLELVHYITRNTLMPLMLALPVLAVLIWAVVGHALAPLQRLAREVSMREPDALHPIDDDDTPREVHVLLLALNQLFDRLRSAIRRERQFTADAAHELRTPLAAMKTHLQVARAQSAEAATRASLDKALEGVDRATHSVEQLLVLARADAAQTKAMVDTPVDLREIAAAVVSGLSQQAVERDIDLGLDAAEAISVRGDATALQLLARNLVDNAVRYTPPGGTVTVTVTRDAQGASLAVADDGVGVPVEERPKIFNRFHRGSGEQALGADGSGLGLAIVKRVADLHGARIVLGEGLNGRGLRVRLEFAPD